MLLRADARSLPLQDACIDCVVTSPPYWGLRDYGDPQQIGLEPAPDAYVANLVAVFQDVRRVLKDSGTVWLNIGDSYAATSRGTGGPSVKQLSNRDSRFTQTTVTLNGIKPKQLIGIPWRIAFALQADGWYLRSDIIWHKPNPMPESVTDRPTKAHEYLFLLTKNDRYYYDADAIKESGTTSIGNWWGPGAYPPDVGTRQRKRSGTGGIILSAASSRRVPSYTPISGRNRRTVWTIATEPYSGAHFATMPEALVEPCILAGCPLAGLVLDPFVGSGTVVAVAQSLGRRGVGVDLSYQGLATTRTAQLGLPFGPGAQDRFIQDDDGEAVYD